MQAKKGTMQSSKGTHKSLFIHTLQLPRRPVEETNTGKEVECSALPPTPHTIHNRVRLKLSSLEVVLGNIFFLERRLLSHNRKL